MAAENEEMAVLAENLWNNYLRKKVEDMLGGSVSFYRAKVTNKRSGKLTVQRPYDTPVTIPATDRAYASATINKQVMVLCMGSPNNSIVISDGAMSEL